MKTIQQLISKYYYFGLTENQEKDLKEKGLYKNNETLEQKLQSLLMLTIKEKSKGYGDYKIVKDLTSKCIHLTIDIIGDRDNKLELENYLSLFLERNKSTNDYLNDNLLVKNFISDTLPEFYSVIGELVKG